MTESNDYEYREGDKIVGIKATNKHLGLTMSVIPRPVSPQNSIEVAFYDEKTEKPVAFFTYGPGEIDANPKDEDFWTEFGERYAARFENLKTINRNEIEREVFPDLVEKSEEKR